MMKSSQTFQITRWTPISRLALGLIAVVLAVLALAPTVASAGVVDRLTVLFVYILLAAMWNALAGFGGLVSIGQHMFFGLGAYLTIRLADTGLDPFASMAFAAALVGVIALAVSYLMLHLRGGEFAIGMWVLAALTHRLVNLDPLIQGETGTSLISLNVYEIEVRRIAIYWAGLASMTALLAALFVLLRSKTGAAIQAIRDSEEAAAAIGVNVIGTKRLLFVLAATGIGLAGGLWLASAISFQPKTYFSVQWTAYMIFMVLVGGIGTFEGAILGAVLFFLIESWFGDAGGWYLIGLGATALFFSLFFPKGLWGAIERRLPHAFLPIGYTLSDLTSQAPSRLTAQGSKKLKSRGNVE